MLNLYAKIFSCTDYSVTPAASFAEAASLLKKEEFDLLVTDFMFPDGVGTELIRLYNEAKEDARSLLVTGSPSADAQRACAGISCFIEKPFKVEQFLEAVEKALA